MPEGNGVQEVDIGTRSDRAFTVLKPEKLSRSKVKARVKLSAKANRSEAMKVAAQEAATEFNLIDPAIDPGSDVVQSKGGGKYLIEFEVVGKNM